MDRVEREDGGRVRCAWCRESFTPLHDRQACCKPSCSRQHAAERHDGRRQPDLLSDAAEAHRGPRGGR